MKTPSEEDFLALHLHRSLDGKWYVVGTTRNIENGTNANMIVSEFVAQSTIAKILTLLASNSEAERLVVRLENAADYLEMCSKIPEVAWDHPIIERRYTAVDVLRQAAHHVETGEFLD